MQPQNQALHDVNQIYRSAGYSQSAGMSKSPKMRDSMFRFLFSPALRIDIGDRRLSFGAIPQGRFLVIENEPYKTRNEDTDLEAGEFVENERSAKDVANELYRAYADSGVVIIHSLVGKSEEAALAIEEDLLTGLESDTAAAMLRQLRRVAPKSDAPPLLKLVYAEMLQATVNVIAIMDTKRSSYEKQMKAALTSGKGPTSADPMMKKWCYTLEKPTPDDLEEELQRRREQGPQFILQPAAIPASTVETAACTACNGEVPLRGGKFPRICMHCGRNPLEFAVDEGATGESAKPKKERKTASKDAKPKAETEGATTSQPNADAATTPDAGSTDVRTGGNLLSSALPDLAPRTAPGNS
jgi:hypothetical protein